MKLLLHLLISLFLVNCTASKLPGKVRTLQVFPIPLPAELADANKQFSGLFISASQLWILPECRLQEHHEPVLYTIPIGSLDDVINNRTTSIDYRKIPLDGLAYIKNKIEGQGQKYEGLEAMVIQDNSIYLSLETNTEAPYEFILKGTIYHHRVVLDTGILFSFRKPMKNGDRIYNASIESMALFDHKLVAVFEYNSFPAGNFVYTMDTSLQGTIDSVGIDPVPFRITDISITGPGHATAINYFYNGGGRDGEFRPSKEEPAYSQVTGSSGFFSYNRLLDLHFTKNRISWSVIGEMPKQYWQYNWEGIAAYKNGYFLINDKYTSVRPYQSVLVFVKP